MNAKTYLHIFYKGAGLSIADDEDAICIGEFLPIYCPEGLEKVMEYHCKVIDALISISKSSLQTVQLLALRGLTFHEFNTVLFDTTIKEGDFGKYPALRCLFLSSDRERREKVIYGITRDWHGYEKLLAQILQPFNPNLFEFVFGYEN